MTKAKITKQVAEQPEEKAPEALSFEDFLAKNQGVYNPGLLASFKYEETYGSDELRKGLEPRSEENWAKALDEQSNRTY